MIGEEQETPAPFPENICYICDIGDLAKEFASSSVTRSMYDLLQKANHG